MVLTSSVAMPLGAKAPSFSLPDAEGKTHSLDDFANSKAIVVVFMCNHCPYVKHIADGLARFADEYREPGVAVVGINSNDFAAYPDDAPAKMLDEVKQRGYAFPYLVDESQEVAKAYSAACTPDFFLLDGEQRIVYHGQFDKSRPGNEAPVTGEDLRAAVAALLRGEPIDETQPPSLGCNIKWRPGKEPSYFQSR